MITNLAELKRARQQASTMRCFGAFTLADALTVAHNASPIERIQTEAFTGKAYSADDEAVALSRLDSKWIARRPDGEPVMAGGLLFVTDWRVQTVTLSTTRWPKLVKSITQDARRVLLSTLFAPGVQRVQCYSLATRSDAHAWYERIGFNRDGCLNHYGAGGEDIAVHAMIRR